MTRRGIAFRLAPLQDRSAPHAPNGKPSDYEAKKEKTVNQIKPCTAKRIKLV